MTTESWSSFHRRHGSYLSPQSSGGFPGASAAQQSTESPAGAFVKNALRCLVSLFGKSPRRENAKRRRQREMATYYAQSSTSARGGTSVEQRMLM
mmetsp:Transcript_15837/g.45448  ORF Transcript_15837/g.45448 Transcript_15837/m.45448 type:complete len:95 (+) Transcript_15837:301-585(+)